MSLNREFHKVFLEKGGLFDVDNLDEKDFLRKLKLDINMEIALIKKVYPLAPDIHFDFIYNSEINASVDNKDGVFFVGIYIGTFFLLSDMFMKMLSTKKVLAHVGNIDKESSEKITINALQMERGVGFRYEEDYNLIFPNDIKRKTYAETLTNFALKFLVYHECGHIIRGHLGYVKNSKFEYSWDEYLPNSAEYNKGILNLRQTLEMDADSFAVNRSFILGKIFTLELKVNSKESKYYSELYSWIYRDIATFVRTWSFSIYSMFRLFGFYKIDLDRAVIKDHPPCIMRINMILSNLMKIIKLDKSLNFEEMFEASFFASQEAEESFTHVTYSDNLYQDFWKLGRTDYFRLYIKELLANWNTLRPELEKHAYGKLPPLNSIK
jgi:hypothetical protein